MSHCTALTEQQVLDMLKIPDFRHLSKENVMSFASMLNQMNPEVAAKAIEQFPCYVDAVKSVTATYSDVVKTGLRSNSESMVECYKCAEAIIATIQSQLNRDDLCTEDRKDLLTALLEVQKLLHTKDSENKLFLQDALARIGRYSLIFVGVLAVLFGARADFRIPRKILSSL